MANLGKVDREFFDELIYPNLGAPREDVTLGPQHGVDFGAIAVGGRTAVLATDPVFVNQGADPFWGAFEENVEKLEGDS